MSLQCHVWGKLIISVGQFLLRLMQASDHFWYITVHTGLGLFPKRQRCSAFSCQNIGHLLLPSSQHTLVSKIG
uniref:Putative secreted protein n=1 Tax=Panstrongylus lignarius TaxID=156445 RepID=A0A224XTZ8_9HEMI